MDEYQQQHCLQPKMSTCAEVDFFLQSKMFATWHGPAFFPAGCPLRVTEAAEGLVAELA